MKQDATESIQILAQIVQPDDKNMFHVNTFTFKAETSQIKESWINILKDYSGRSCSSSIWAMDIVTVDS